MLNMSSSGSQYTPLYVVKWKLKANERGRSHMAVFVPNPQCKNIDPNDTSQRCTGTLLQVQGSPMTRFSHNIKRNWDRKREQHVEFFHLVSRILSQHVPEPPASNFDSDVERPNGLLDQVALTVRPPEPSSRLSDAVRLSFVFRASSPYTDVDVQSTIFDCQDWVIDLMTRLVQRRLIDAAALETTQSLMDPRVALISEPGSSSTHSLPLTASIAWPYQQQPAQSVVPAQARAAIYTSSEWDNVRRVFRRYDQSAQRWEYRDASGAWKSSM